MKIKEIRRLDDLKKILSKIPDKDLEKFGIGINIESDGQIDMLVEDEGDIDLFDKYPQLHAITDYINNICNFAIKIEKEEVNLDDYVEEPFITSRKKK